MLKRISYRKLGSGDNVKPVTLSKRKLRSLQRATRHREARMHNKALSTPIKGCEHRGIGVSAEGCELPENTQKWTPTFSAPREYHADYANIL